MNSRYSPESSPNGAQTDVELSALQNVFLQKYPQHQGRIFDELMKRGYFLHRPDYVRGATSPEDCRRSSLVFIGNMLSQKTGVAIAPFIVAAILSGGIIAGFGWFMPARTPDGAKALAGVLGFEDFLTHVESDHMNRGQPDSGNIREISAVRMALAWKRMGRRVPEYLFATTLVVSRRLLQRRLYPIMLSIAWII